VPNLLLQLVAYKWRSVLLIVYEDIGREITHVFLRSFWSRFPEWILSPSQTLYAPLIAGNHETYLGHRTYLQLTPFLLGLDVRKFSGKRRTEW